MYIWSRRITYLRKMSPPLLFFKEHFSFHIWFIVSQPTGADVLTQLGKHWEKLYLKAKTVAVRMVLINSKALLVPFCVHFEMLVVYWDGSQMRPYWSLVVMQLWHTVFKEDRREEFGQMIPCELGTVLREVLDSWSVHNDCQGKPNMSGRPQDSGIRMFLLVLLKYV